MQVDPSDFRWGCGFLRTDSLPWLLPTLNLTSCWCPPGFLVSSLPPLALFQVRGRTALMIALEHSTIEKVKLLLDAGADLAAEDRFGDTALHKVPTSVDSDSNLELLLAKSKAELNQQNALGQTPLLCAAYFGEFDCIERLLDAGADASLPDNEGRILLHHAAQQLDACLVQRLLDADPDSVNAQEIDGHTPLMATVFHDSRREIFELDPQAAVEEHSEETDEGEEEDESRQQPAAPESEDETEEDEVEARNGRSYSGSS
eukprot:m.670039 g.670039  ORF g.670039 m.670039 type:complete len:260 (+) comp58526_c0_seq9:1211-1990(+)